MTERLSNDRLAEIGRLIAEAEASFIEAERVNADDPDPDLGAWHVTNSVGVGDIEALLAEVRDARGLPAWDRREAAKQVMREAAVASRAELTQREQEIRNFLLARRADGGNP